MAKADTANMDFFEKVGYVFSLWGESWKGFKLNLWTFIILYVLPIGLLTIVLTFSLAPALAKVNENVTLATTGVVTASIIALLAFFALLLLIPAQIVTQLASAKGKEISIGEALSTGMKFLLQYILAAIISAVIIVGPMVLSMLLVLVLIGVLLLPFAFVWAIVAAFFLYLVPYVLITENLQAVDAIKRSFELTREKWQWVLAIVIVTTVISILGSVPVIGVVLGLALGIVYLCMPAIVFTKYIAKQHKTEAKKS